ncbi:MAG: colanic acid biosynthesis glycosyltransferase WcaL [Bacteroidetes bacterium]|nr:MAG: colanic acid biosynthesis glycosyltransferase WcaL [Bacteroidota bacterium]
MNIAFVVGPFPLPSETFIVNQIVGLLKLGHEVRIFALSEETKVQVHELVTEFDLISKTTFKPVVPNNIFIRYAKALLLAIGHLGDIFYVMKSLNFIEFGRSALNLRKFYEIVPFLKLKGFDIVHAHFGPNGNRALKVRELGLLKGKLITTFHGSDTNTSFMNAKSDVYKELFKACNLITVNSSFTFNNVASLGCNPDKIQILPMGVDVDKFSKRINMGDEHVIKILSVARLIELKGIEYGIRAIAILLNSGKLSKIHYQIIGDGPLINSLKALTRDLGVESHVSFSGAQTHEYVLEKLQETDIFLMPGIVAKDGRSEAQGLVIQEAQSMEIPVVVSAVGGMAEGMQDGVTGFLVSPKNPEIIAEKLKYLIAQPKKRKEMGENGRKFVTEKFNIQSLNRTLINLYKELF